MDGGREGWIDGCMDVRMYGCICGCMDVWHGCMDAWMCGLLYRYMDTHTYIYTYDWIFGQAPK